MRNYNYLVQKSRDKSKNNSSFCNVCCWDSGIIVISDTDAYRTLKDFPTNFRETFKFVIIIIMSLFSFAFVITFFVLLRNISGHVDTTKA